MFSFGKNGDQKLCLQEDWHPPRLWLPAACAAPGGGELLLTATRSSFTFPLPTQTALCEIHAPGNLRGKLFNTLVPAIPSLCRPQTWGNAARSHPVNA